MPSITDLTRAECLKMRRLKARLDVESEHSDLTLCARPGYFELLIPVQHEGQGEDLGAFITRIFFDLRGAGCPDLEGVELLGDDADWQRGVVKACRLADVSVFVTG